MKKFSLHLFIVNERSGYTYSEKEVSMFDIFRKT